MTVSESKHDAKTDLSMVKLCHSAKSCEVLTIVVPLWAGTLLSVVPVCFVYICVVPSGDILICVPSLLIMASSVFKNCNKSLSEIEDNSIVAVNSFAVSSSVQVNPYNCKA